MSNAQDSSVQEDKRRSVLASLHLQPNEEGRFAEGLRDTDRILVATFNNPVVAYRLKCELSKLAVPSWARSDGYKTSIEINFRDRGIAFQHLEDFRRREPDSIPLIRRKPYDFVLLFGALGAVAGVGALQLDFPQWLVVWGGFIANGLFFGYAIDPGLRLRRNGAPHQLSLIDILLITASISLALGSFKLLMVAFG